MQPLGTVDGVWDIGQVTSALGAADRSHGRLPRPGRARQRRAPERDPSALGQHRPAECDGCVDGFAHGDADPRLALLRRRLPAPARCVEAQRAGHAAVDLDAQRAARERSAGDRHHLRARPRSDGLRSRYRLHFDLDADGVFDLAVREGTGTGPGHKGEVPKTDHAWYRLFVANVAGRWVVLGTVVFGYGCGC